MRQFTTETAASFSVTSDDALDAGFYTVGVDFWLTDYPSALVHTEFSITISGCLVSLITPPSKEIEKIIHAIGTQ